MTKEEAKIRTKQIDAEQRILGKKSSPFQLILALTAIGNMSSVKEMLPPFITNDYLMGGLLFVAALGLVWTYVNQRKLNKEKDEILSKYGIW